MTNSGAIAPGTLIAASCPFGKKVLGGGADVSPKLGGHALAESGPVGNAGWQASYTSTVTTLDTVTVWAICANVS